MRKQKAVKTDKLRIRETNNDYSHYRDRFDGVPETASANPDVLGEADSINNHYKRGPKEKRALQLMDRAVDLLNDQQRKAYIGYYRDNKSEKEIGDDLGIKQQSVSELLRRALVSIADFCERNGHDLAMGGGDDAR